MNVTLTCIYSTGPPPPPPPHKKTQNNFKKQQQVEIVVNTLMVGVQKSCPISILNTAHACKISLDSQDKIASKYISIASTDKLN